jgi:hypothetical protein
VDRQVHGNGQPLLHLRGRPRLWAVLSQILYLLPYTAKLCLNGHEYGKRQLAREGIAFEALDNSLPRRRRV